MKIEVVDLNSPHLATVKKLGKQNAATLGFLPEGAFDDYSQKKQILAAINENKQCVGYVLYRIANRKAAIVHLCIDKSHRNKGVSKNLIEQLKICTKDLLGISLRCRRDYEANSIWGKFGFIPFDETEGRGKDHKILVYWFYNHGHPTLFDINTDTKNNNKIDLIVDANVFYDFDNPKRDGYIESNSLKADWLEDSINICLVSEIYQEINRCEDEDIRKISRIKAAQFTILNHDETKFEAIYEKIKEIFPRGNESLSISDKSDIRQVSTAICADSQYFITRDGGLLKENVVEETFKQFGLKILRPADLIIHLDEIHRENEYQPAKLSGTAIERTLVKSGQEEIITKTFQQQEPKPLFQNRIRSFLPDIKNYQCWLIKDEKENVLALVIYKISNQNRLEIPLLRLQKNNLSATLVRHLILKSINDSIVANNNSIEINDNFLSKETKSALVEEGFINTNDSWVKFHLQIVGSKQKISNHLNSIQSKSEEEKNLLSNLSSILDKNYYELNLEIFADIEKVLYPIKIADSLLPNFIIPIQPHWAKELFDEDLANQGLFPAKRDLALRKEQVYYRSKLNSGGLKAPARILWYISQGNSNYVDVGAIRACSMVDEVLIEKPKVVFNLFKRLGIYEWKNVYETAKNDVNNEIMAIKFSHTELFNRPVKLDKLRKLFEEFNRSLPLYSPFSISKELFIEIYKEGIINTKQ